uniref:Uncharacterized protein n=1 Tax=Panagrellus redivivus TaxID=6233 RepID=A0A7E4VF47_PANRE
MSALEHSSVFIYGVWLKSPSPQRHHEGGVYRLHRRESVLHVAGILFHHRPSIARSPQALVPSNVDVSTPTHYGIERSSPIPMKCFSYLLCLLV